MARKHIRLIGVVAGVALWLTAAEAASTPGKSPETPEPPTIGSVAAKAAQPPPAPQPTSAAGKTFKKLDATVLITAFLQALGGLGLFLLGMKYLSDGMQTIAGDRLRRMIGFATNHRLAGAAVGTGVTSVIQSSSVTTVMVVGFVNAGLMTLQQAIPVIMGANIGTTITAWMLALKIGKFGLPIVGVAALVYRFARQDRWRFLALAVLGVGMVFFGLEIMKRGLGGVKETEEFHNLFMLFTADTYGGVLKCASIGCLLTMVVQSSSATIGITIALASGGAIPFETAAALVLGENIGTTITAFLASLGATTNAKRAAYAHIIFNVLGVAWITAIFAWYIRGVKIFCGVGADGNIGHGQIEYAIAVVHSGFNITNTLLFLPLSSVLGGMLIRMFPDKPYKEAPHLTNLDVRLLETPTIGIEQARREVVHMGDQTHKMLLRLREIVVAKQADHREVNKVFHKERILDVIQKEVVEFLTQLLTGNVPREIAAEGRRIVRIADEYESVSDYVTNILKLHLRLRHDDLEFFAEERKGLLELHDLVTDYVVMVNEACAEGRAEVLSRAETFGNEISHKARELRSQHLTDMVEARNGAANPVMSMIYADMLNAYRRVKDHAFNVAEAVAGEK